MEHTVRAFRCFDALSAAARAKGHSVFAVLNQRLCALRDREGFESVAELAAAVHVLPTFHGNRSPLNDATLRGALCGLALDGNADDDLDACAVRYLATLCALCYESKLIFE